MKRPWRISECEHLLCGLQMQMLSFRHSSFHKLWLPESTTFRVAICKWFSGKTRPNTAWRLGLASLHHGICMSLLWQIFNQHRKICWRRFGASALAGSNLRWSCRQNGLPCIFGCGECKGALNANFAARQDEDNNEWEEELASGCA